ncbi:MAG: bifunctional 23S rRNA (guanine(2069)-N(7))-methyltransferase RlmK/23S rRNA (guanine(2445)-N(2))-methyltransferase RlmL [Magnetococcales bacterium]|nr:bifunctional 23S rRNA (guanine(2069)-N(7))-methyltransferase RlmK/23S rRNA (guanine(2445)-N(2))-methyltransferase RlmL [Magnetococcales bacterium]
MARERGEHGFFAASPAGLEGLLVAELRELGAVGVRPQRGGALFRGSVGLAQRVCLWSRVASRVLLPLGEAPSDHPEALREAVQALPWEDHLDPEGTLRVDFTGVNAVFRHTLFGAQTIKDGVVDRMRERFGRRPSVSDDPDLSIHARLTGERIFLGVDLSGTPLHRRGYRREPGAAPLRENLAAAVLLLAGWREIAQQGGTLLDPMCGSGTLLIEGAWIAGDAAPGLLRGSFGFTRWLGRDDAAWRETLEEARHRAAVGLAKLPPIAGRDIDLPPILNAEENLRAAGLLGKARLVQGDLAQWDGFDLEGLPPGLVAVNPPYGERLGEVEALRPLYRLLGDCLRGPLVGWRYGILTASPALEASLGLKPEEVHPLWNGPLACHLLTGGVTRREHQWGSEELRSTVPAVELPANHGEMFANRLRTNLRHLGRWARKQGITCYRLYDADIPEFSLAVDLYGEWLHLQEYAPPQEIDPRWAAARLKMAVEACSAVLGIPPERIFLKERRRTKEGGQYERLREEGVCPVVEEGGLKFRLNLSDYLDTGLFLDHRLTRELIRSLAGGRHVLNLFAYTGSASVYAWDGGAASVTTVDLSANYLEWAQANMLLNGFSDPNIRFVRDDCRDWLLHQREPYDLIFLDPPTFSRSKAMAGTLDIQRDHVPLIQEALRLLAPGGILIFSTNYRRFKMQVEALPRWAKVREITPQTIPEDFRRTPRIHQCWRLERES